VTEVVQPTRRGEAYRFIRDQVGKGRQAFVICPRIETNDKQRLTSGKAPKNRLASLWSEVKAVKDEYEKLSKTIFPDLRIGMLHGKMTPKEKERTMKDFAQRKTDILVSTSVVEVGVDIPNASMMVIESADRFGLASLHQFRGRIGRGPHQSYCLLFSDSAGKETNARLEALIRAKNGFELAERDLAIRGPGEFLGEEQSGIPDIAMEALKDRELVEAARLEAHALLSKDGSARSWPMALTERLASFHKKVHPE